MMLETTLLTETIGNDLDNPMGFSRGFLLGFLVGPLLFYWGYRYWTGRNRNWSIVGAMAHGVQIPSVLIMLGLMGTSFAIAALPAIWPETAYNPALITLAVLLILASFWAMVFGILTPLLALIWWPIHRIWGPRWYTMLNKQQFKLFNTGTDLLDIGGKHPRPRAKRHLQVWYGRQITPEAPRTYPKAAAGHLWAAKTGIYFDPWQTSLGEHYRTLTTWNTITNTQVIPAIKRAQNHTLAFDHNPLNWVRGPKLVIETHTNGHPHTLQYTLNYRGAKHAQTLIDQQRNNTNLTSHAHKESHIES